jgi:hypothetical protein
MPARTYRRLVGAFTKLCVGIALVLSILVLSKLNSALVHGLWICALFLFVLGLVELTQYVAVNGDAVSDDSRPKEWIRQTEASTVQYKLITTLGARRVRFFVFTVMDKSGKTAVIPRYGYLQATRRELFAWFDGWLGDTSVQLDARTSSALRNARG